jgi:hypothetical protein
MPAGSPVLANRKHIMREAIEIELHPESMNREEAFSPSKSWKHLLQTLTE